MKFTSFGVPGGQTGLLIHPMFTSAEVYAPLIKHLGPDVFCLVPTLDGHDGESRYESEIREADRIVAECRRLGLTRLDFLLGVSMGAVVAMEVFRRGELVIDRVYLDGGVFFHFPRTVIHVASQKFWSICSGAKADPRKGARKLEEAFPDMGALMCSVCSGMERESMLPLARTCYRYPLPELSPEEQARVHFLFGTKEPARFCIKRLKRYPCAEIRMQEGYSHCGYLLTHPEEYAAMLLKKGEARRSAPLTK